MQPAGNDLYGFYVMHYMCSIINALSGSQVWPLSPFSKFGWPHEILTKAFLNCVSPFSCVPDWSVIYTGADRFGYIWVPRRSFWFHYGPSREHQGSPSPYLIKVLVLWKLYICCCWMLDIMSLWLKTMFVAVVFVWIFVSRWWCIFGYNTLSLSIYVASDV
jgi:hypothetical protein